MCENGKIHNRDFRAQNQAIVMNASQLENETEIIENSSKSYNVVKLKAKNIKTKGLLERETNMTYIFSHDFVTDISKTFKDKKFVQKVLPTKFSKEFLGTNADDLLTPNTPDNDGRYHQICHCHLNV